jgi:hypothetical protein
VILKIYPSHFVIGYSIAVAILFLCIYYAFREIGVIKALLRHQF